MTIAAVQCLPVTRSPTRRRSRVHKNATIMASRASRIRPEPTTASRCRVPHTEPTPPVRADRPPRQSCRRLVTLRLPRRPVSSRGAVRTALAALLGRLSPRCSDGSRRAARTALAALLGRISPRRIGGALEVFVKRQVRPPARSLRRDRVRHVDLDTQQRAAQRLAEVVAAQRTGPATAEGAPRDEIQREQIRRLVPAHRPADQAAEVGRHPLRRDLVPDRLVRLLAVGENSDVVRVTLVARTGAAQVAQLYPWHP